MNNENFENTENQHNNKLTPTMAPNKAAILGLIAVFFIFQFGGGLLTVAIFGSNFKDADQNLIRLFTIGSQILFILFPAILLSKLVFEDVTEVVRFRFPDRKEIGLFVIGLMILIPLTQYYLYFQNYFLAELSKEYSFIHSVKIFLDEIDKLAQSTYLQLLSANYFYEYFLVIFTVAVTPAICEEFFFRGFVQKSFEFKQKPFTAILLTSLFFGFYHFNPYGLIPLILLSFYLGYAVYKSNSIFTSIVLHFLNNFFAIMVFFIYGKDELIQSNVLNSETLTEDIIVFIVLLLLFIGFFIIVNRNYFKIINGRNANDLSKM
ncbi:MAG: CPBP family intramembrane metalloprotease domain-containing protein [Ignavibacteriae bacterium]|nr:MAG: CPBP family intramembrane metalloprotease domain-containing protein [Ignavibacteriota bacterium]